MQLQKANKQPPQFRVYTGKLLYSEDNLLAAAVAYLLHAHTSLPGSCGMTAVPDVVSALKKEAWVNHELLLNHA